MSYLSASESIGFNVLPQNISESSCATQYMMAVDNVADICASEASPYISNGTSVEQTYLIPHINDNFFQSKFKIDPNELYTFHDTDIIAGEVTVANSEDTIIEVVDFNPKLKSNKNDKIKLSHVVTNGVVIKKQKKDVVNGNLKPVSKPISAKSNAVATKNNGKSQAKVPKPKNQQVKEPKPNSKARTKSLVSSSTTSTPTRTIIKTNVNRGNMDTPPPDPKAPKASSAVTFLDVFMREQGLDDVKVKLEPPDSPPPLVPLGPPPLAPLAPPPPPPPLAPPLIPPPLKDPSLPQAQKKASTASTSGAASITKSASSKARRGRGPTHHEALQRISRRAAALPVRAWHAPGHELFDMRPLSETPPNRYRRLESSSDEDDYMPNFGIHLGCVEEGAVENREQRISLRKAALRRQLALGRKALRLARAPARPRDLAACLKKHLERQPARVPQHVVNELLMRRGMTSILTAEDKKLLRSQGWSGGERVARAACSQAACGARALPCAATCARHAAGCARLLAPCSAVFAGGARCPALLVPLQDGAPLCDQHRAKRDNYDRISREMKPKKTVVRKKPEVESKKAKRRRRPPPPPRLLAAAGQDTRVVTVVGGAAGAELPGAALGADHFIVTDECDVQELEVEHVASDDILVDPSVLSQIPDEAFTEFFNQAEGSGAFDSSSELTRALEAVLDERALDTLADCAPPALAPPAQAPPALAPPARQPPSPADKMATVGAAPPPPATS